MFANFEVKNSEKQNIQFDIYGICFGIFGL